MIVVFRLLILLAIASLLVACVTKFKFPISFTVQLDQPPPVWLLLGMVQMCAIVAILISAIGLLLFQRWAVYVGVVAFLAVSTLLVPVGDHRIVVAMGASGVVPLGIFAAAWIAALACTRSAGIGSRFSR